MAFPYRRILAPIEFDDTAHAVLDAAVRIATETGGTVFLMHVVPMVVAPTGMPNYVDIYKDQEKIAQQKLAAIVECRRAEVKCELMTRIGDPAHEILGAGTPDGGRFDRARDTRPQGGPADAAGQRGGGRLA